MALQVRALYVHDGHGRLAAANAPPGDDPEPPLFFLGRTAHGNLWRFRAGLPDSLVRELARLAAAERVEIAPDRDPERLRPMLERVEAHVPVRAVWRGPAFRFPDALPHPGAVVALGPDDRSRVGDFRALSAALPWRLPAFAVEDAGELVSVAYCATRPGADAPAVEAGVDTLPGSRGHGYATRAVAAWAAAVRRTGALPLYSTSFENRASRGVARRLGLIRYGTDLHLR